MLRFRCGAERCFSCESYLGAVLVWDCGGWEVENAEVCSTMKSYGWALCEQGVRKKE